MTTMPNYHSSDDLAFQREAKKSARGEDTAVRYPKTIARVEGVYHQRLALWRLLSAACFFSAAGLAVMTPKRSPGLMVALLAMAVVMSVASKWMARRAW